MGCSSTVWLICHAARGAEMTASVEQSAKEVLEEEEEDDMVLEEDEEGSRGRQGGAVWWEADEVVARGC
jgi:hypothetical protein